MMDWMTNHKREVDFSLKLYKRLTATQGSILIINLLGIAWNAYELSAGRSFSAFGLGAFISNALWSLGFFAMNYGELRDAKEQRKRLQEWEKGEEYKQSVQFHNAAKKRYDDALAEFYAKNPSSKVNVFVQGEGGWDDGKPDVGASASNEPNNDGFNAPYP